MRRFFAENLDTSADSVTLQGDEARHMLTVLRMKVGDEVLLIGGDGTECSARITSCCEGTVTLAIIERASCAAEPTIEITLFQCLPKQGKMELIIQKCVELGVSRIVPTIAERCVVRLDGKDNRLQRWNRVSLEAAKQCGRAAVPEVLSPQPLADIRPSDFELCLLAYENESDTGLKKVLQHNKNVKSIAIIIGAEGGFSPREVKRLTDGGAVTVSLGRRILRTETAGMAMLAQLMYEMEG